MRFLVTGATGFVGQTIVDAALEAGHTVRGMARDAVKAAQTFADRPIDVVLGDGGSRRDLLIALEGMEVVVNAAATYSYRREAAETMLRDNPAIMEAILSAARDAGTPHVIDVSSAVVFLPHADGPNAGIVGVHSPRWDASWPQWHDPYLQSKVLAEDVVDRHRAKGVPVSSIHPALTIGPRDSGPGQSGAVVRALLADPSIYLDAMSGWVDVRDVADAVVRLASRPPGDRVIACATSARYRVVAAELDRLTGRAIRRLWLPPRLLTMAADINDRLGGRLLPALPTRPSLEWPLTASPVDGSSGERLLGRPYRPLEISLEDTLRWWAANDVVPRSWIGRLGAT